MRHALTKVLAGLLIPAAIASAQSTQPATLGVGDAAPAIKVAGWAKGTPVTAFEPGKVYVVEFWATWCGPCKRSIPHLTELAKQYDGKVTVVGVSVWEHPEEETDAAVKEVVLPFVKSMGEKMDYTVAIDGTAGVMAATWLKAAGQEAIPASFVVDGTGRIAWIGLPTGLGPVLERVTAGTWSIEGEKKRLADAAIAEVPRKAATDKILKAFRAKDPKATLAALDEAQATYPDALAHPDFISVRLEALMQTDPAAAVAYVRKTTAPGGEVAAKPNYVWSILRVLRDPPDDGPFTVEQWKSIAAAIEASVNATQPFALLYEKYASVLEHAGDKANAAVYQRKAVDLAGAYNASHAGQLTKADTDQLDRMQKRLDALAAK